MTDLADLLIPDAVMAGVIAANRKALFQQIGTVAAAAWSLDPAEIVERLTERERLGSTGFGGGIALPHGRFAGLDRVCGVFARLDRPVDFGAMDELPVDIVFALFSPEHAGADHLKALARVSRRLREADFAAKLRGAGSPDALYALLAGLEARDAA